MTEQEFITYFTKVTEDAAVYLGTKKYTHILHRLVDLGKEFPRQDDLEISIINLYINNYIEMWEAKHTGQKFVAENIFRIRLPKWMKIVENK